ncbi:hypothetical protein BELL_0234g00160 [Botrytis elliptica]|uniref:chitinase n=1 Tax=Botrytis elliptica TaxID=278938 RepID=A0A4Z1JU32_9HELO|nr:hypothetical protein EAE99_001146 [Botrytis elliptica]TGO75110.1 hypothetical protein BELL_0234g00160 [Botrytis elliptica]
MSVAARFCGISSEFCDVSTCQSNCGTPSLPEGRNSFDVRNNVIGYYESWSTSRACHPFPPSAIPVDGLQRVNFAFAYIDPNTLEVKTMDSTIDEDLFKQVADVKSSSSGNSALEVYVSIGGWAFSDDHTATQPLFSNIAGNEANRTLFSQNVLQFLTTYGFDGVDLDWEYPGAEDRGGSETDVQGYPLLVKQLRETFDKSPKGDGLGITFTVPSSYWYLRWFDLPKMVPYINSINMMTYDLHGVWDSHSHIGSIVQAHTNLTEIKLAMELLWRNNVPPEKVVLGLGFYGRAFQLLSTDCQVPGCMFSGASAKGPCTGEGGILGYFEIQDILNDPNQHIDIKYDEAAAINYFTYNTNQWVSYDNETTFAQKVEYANSIGYVLIHSKFIAFDMDDNDFSALSGLLGRDNLGTISSKALEDQATVDTSDWASQNGQKCYMGTCGGGCLLGKEVEISRANSCSGGKPICCPIDAAPSCTWRGGESGRSCHGTCHTGEVTLFYDNYGIDGPQCFSPGRKVFCCTTTTFTEVIESCKYAGCGKGCDTGYESVASKYDPLICAFDQGGSGPQDRKLCCPTSPHIGGCHWVGKGGCDQNNCDDNDIQLDLDGYGDSHKLCSLPGRSKSLCCNAPTGDSPFLPVALDRIFPTLPEKVDVPKWDLQALGLPMNIGPGAGGVDNQGFGFVLIDGPSSVVTTMSKRDGSDYVFLGCPVGKSRQKVRILCNSNSLTSNCHEILEDGVDGTIIKLPEGCGPGTYAVAHSLSLSDNQKLPSIYTGAANRTVSDLEISYDFGLVKRDAGDVYIRIDYSNLEGYWNAVVNSAGESKKRSTDEISKRFFSPNATSWKSKFDDVRSGASSTLDHTLFATAFTSPLYSSSESCEGEDDNYASIGFSGNVSSKARFGYSFVGTIVPFNIVQAYGFSESDIEIIAMLDIQVYGGLKLPDTLANVFPSPVTSKEFSVPGLIHIKPSLQIVATLNANIEMAADFEVFFNTSTPTPIIQYYPSSLGTADGSTAMEAMLLGNGFSDSTAGTARFGFMPTIQIDVTIDSYSTGTVEIHEKISAFHDAYIAITSDGSNCPSLQAGISGAQISLESVAGSFIPWNGDDTSQQILGNTKSSDLPTICPRSSSGRSLILRDLPTDVIKYPAPYVFGNYYLITCAVGLGAGDLLIGPQPGDPEFCSPSPDTFPSSGLFDDDGSELEYEDPYYSFLMWAEDDPSDDLTSRSIEKRTFSKIRVSKLNWATDLAKAATQCSAPRLISNMPISATTIVEHMIEQQTLAKLMWTAAGKIETLPSGATPTLPHLPPAAMQEFVKGQIQSVITGKMGSMMYHIFSIIGSHQFPGSLSLVHLDINALKGQLHDFRVVNFVAAAKWEKLNSSEQMAALMQFFSVYEYMNTPFNAAIGETVYLYILQEFQNWEMKSIVAEGASEWFITFMKDFYQAIDVRASKYVVDKTTGIIKKAGGITRSAQIQEVAEQIQAQVPALLRSSWMDNIGKGPVADLRLDKTGK